MQRCCERKYICGKAKRPRANVEERHIRSCAHARQAQIADLANKSMIVVEEQYIVWFDVSMDDLCGAYACS